MKNYWLKQKRRRMYSRFIEEATACSRRWDAWKFSTREVSFISRMTTCRSACGERAIMANEKKKFQKKKDREKRVHKQILLQREALRAPEREERQFQKKIKRIEKLKKDMGKMNVWADEVFLNMTDKNLSQLEHNAQILKALEQEYQNEHDKKKNLNEELEGQGFLTLDQKLQHLHDKLVQQSKEFYGAGGLEAKEVDRSKPAKEVSDVEVIKAVPKTPEEMLGMKSVVEEMLEQEDQRVFDYINQ